MTPASLPSRPEADATSDRHARILDAAERCFVRSGFHRTTMHDVAAEAGMSPGNLYRYFASKEAMVVGLAERDRARVGEDFSAFTGTEDFLETFARIARKHFAEEPRERAILCLEIWAEATRNRTFATISRDFECDIIQRLANLFAEAQRRGFVSAQVDPNAVAVVVATLADGLFVRRAIAPNFDAEREVGYTLKLVGGLLKGVIDLCPDRDRPGASS
jgi:TetR/AcrR family transcriptional repressor of uid operon